jgi:hypothetical protein
MGQSKKKGDDTVFSKLSSCGYSAEASKAIFDWYHRKNINNFES